LAFLAFGVEMLIDGSKSLIFYGIVLYKRVSGKSETLCEYRSKTAF